MSLPTNADGHRILLFGAGGAIGQHVEDVCLTRGWNVTAVGRSPAAPRSGSSTWVSMDPLAPDFREDALDAHGLFSAVCWAQGANATDSVYNVSMDTHLELYQANCLYIIATLRLLLGRNLLSRGARMCIISSIWQKMARQTKLSYCMTKAALSGLVLSAAADLAIDGHLINAVLPGVLDTPMTRQNLSPEQMEALKGATGFDRLPSLTDVANLVFFLCSAENTGITGQFITADLGFSDIRFL